MKLSIKIFYLFVLAVLSISCASEPKVKRIDADSTTDLSGEWNDTDSRLVAEAMTKDLLSGSWYTRANSISGAIPTIVVGFINNLSHEHINAVTFTTDIERALINSGLIELVASPEQRIQVRDERSGQDVHASEETRKKAGQEIGADLILQGSINTIIDADKNSQVRFYQIDLELIEIETTKKVWIGQKKIKKQIGKDRVRL